MYGFSADYSTLEGSIKSLYGVIPFIGGWIPEGISNAFGFKTIDKKNAYSRIMQITNPILDSAGNLDSITKVANITGSFAKAASVIAKVSGVLSDLVIAGDFIYQLSKKEEVSVNNLIERLLGSSLVSNSHENVSALYYYAKTRMDELIKNGSVSYISEWDGFVTHCNYKTDEIEQLKIELKMLNNLLKE